MAARSPQPEAVRVALGRPGKQSRLPQEARSCPKASRGVGQGSDRARNDLYGWVNTALP